MKGVLLLVLALVVALALAAPAPPPRPVISETFTARIDFEVFNGTGVLRGPGDEARDPANKRSVFHAEVTESHFFFYDLDRYDLGQRYELDSLNWTLCHNTTISGSLPPNWEWLKNASYVGNSTFRDRDFDWWNTTLNIQGASLSFAGGFQIANTTNPPAPTVPTIFITEYKSSTTFERRTVEYLYFTANITDPAFFDVPKFCVDPSKTVKIF